MDQPDGDADSRAMEEGRGKELEHADSIVKWSNRLLLQLQAHLGEIGSPVQS